MNNKRNVRFYLSMVAARWLVLPTVLAVLAPFALAEPATTQVRDEIVSLSQQLMDAIGEGKPQVWNHIVADDAVVVDAFGRKQTKQEIVASLRPAPKGVSGSIRIRDPQVRVYGDTAVIVCEEYERETFFGQKFVVRYVATNTFVHRDGDWKLVAMEYVTLPTPPPKLEVSGLHMRDYPGVYRYGPGHAWTITLHDGVLSYTTGTGRPPIELDPIAKDVFMQDNGERNLVIFRRDASGQVVAMILRRKFNDLTLTRKVAATATGAPR